DQVPAGEGEDARLHGVEHGHEQVGALDVALLGGGEPGQVLDAQGGGGDGGGGAGDAVGRLQVVGCGRADEPAVHLGADDLAELAAPELLAAEGEDGVLVPGP